MAKKALIIIPVLLLLFLVLGITREFLGQNKEAEIIETGESDIVAEAPVEKTEAIVVKPVVVKESKPAVKKTVKPAKIETGNVEPEVETVKEDIAEQSSSMLEEIDISEIEAEESTKPVYQKVYLHDGRILIGYVHNLKGVLVIDTADKKYEIEETKISKIEMMAQP